MSDGTRRASTPERNERGCIHTRRILEMTFEAIEELARRSDEWISIKSLIEPARELLRKDDAPEAPSGIEGVVLRHDEPADPERKGDTAVPVRVGFPASLDLWPGRRVRIRVDDAPEATPSMGRRYGVVREVSDNHVHIECEAAPDLKEGDRVRIGRRPKPEVISRAPEATPAVGPCPTCGATIRLPPGTDAHVCSHRAPTASEPTGETAGEPEISGPVESLAAHSPGSGHDAARLSTAGGDDARHPDAPGDAEPDVREILPAAREGSVTAEEAGAAARRVIENREAVDRVWKYLNAIATFVPNRSHAEEIVRLAARDETEGERIEGFIGGDGDIENDGNEFTRHRINASDVPATLIIHRPPAATPGDSQEDE